MPFGGPGIHKSGYIESETAIQNSIWVKYIQSVRLYWIAKYVFNLSWLIPPCLYLLDVAMASGTLLLLRCCTNSSAPGGGHSDEDDTDTDVNNDKHCDHHLKTFNPESKKYRHDWERLKYKINPGESVRIASLTTGILLVAHQLGGLAMDCDDIMNIMIALFINNKVNNRQF